MVYDKVLKRLKEHFSTNNDSIELIDYRKDDMHFSLSLISPSFQGMNRLQRSRKIHEILADFFADDTLHSLKMNLKSPDEIL